ncbi:MAG: SWIM zinc finger family protein [Planctomycetota bacterium]
MRFGWRPYVPVARRRMIAARETQRLAQRGQAITPVVIDGRVIAHTFWGKAWCDNLERYSDYENRLPRGRTYARNGSVVHLEVAAGEARALVSGSSLYRVAVKVAPVPRKQWAAIRADCAAGIDSLVALLQGRLSQPVMERICREATGLFPTPSEMEFSCTCPDWASMCKHVAAVLYGVGARLDQAPQLLFALRGVNESELIASAGSGLPMATEAAGSGRVLQSDALAEMFGLELAGTGAARTRPARAGRARTRSVKARKRKVAGKPRARRQAVGEPG